MEYTSKDNLFSYARTKCIPPWVATNLFPHASFFLQVENHGSLLWFLAILVWILPCRVAILKQLFLRTKVLAQDKLWKAGNWALFIAIIVWP